MIYFIQDEAGFVKIGYVRGNPVSRLRAMQLGNASILRLIGSMPGGYAEEKMLQRRFACLNIRGEWFRPGATLLEFVAKLPKAVDDTDAKRIIDSFMGGRSAVNYIKEPQ